MNTQSLPKLSEKDKKRFRAKIHRYDNTDCWLWVACKNPTGYGRFRVNGFTYLAHRIAYESYHGIIPDGMLVLHKCDKPPCCNPLHLFIGTQENNIHDMITKGRAGNSSCLTEEQAIQVKRLAEISELSQREIGLKFGIDQRTVSQIKTGYRWHRLQLATMGETR